MKKLLLLPILAMTVIIAGPAQAGETTTSYKNVTQAPAPELYGTGFYGGFILGGNIFQDEGVRESSPTDLGTHTHRAKK